MESEEEVFLNNEIQSRLENINKEIENGQFLTNEEVYQMSKGWLEK